MNHHTDQDTLESQQLDLISSSVSYADETPLLSSVSNGISMPSSVVFLTNTMTGMGLLAIAFCYRNGIVLNLILTSVLALFSVISFGLLVDVSTKSNLEDYGELMVPTFGQRYKKYSNIIIGLTLFGVIVLYMLFSSSLLKSVLSEIPGIPQILLNDKVLIFGPLILFDLPLSLLKSVSALSKVSYISMVLVIIYVTHSVYYFSSGLMKNGFDPKGEMKLISIGKLLIPSLAIQATTYNCHPNIFPTLQKLENNTRERKTKTMILVGILSFIIFNITGICSYFTLFDNILDPVTIAYYPHGRAFTVVTKILFSLKLVITIPILFFACRLSFYEIFFTQSVSNAIWNSSGIMLLCLAGVFAAYFQSIVKVFEVVGGISSPIIVYILPAAFYIKICQKENKFKYYISYMFILFGLSMILVSLYDTFK